MEALIYYVRTMIGRCSDGAQRDAGKLRHAVQSSADPCWDRALCGTKPGTRGNGWSTLDSRDVTCPRCLSKIEALTRKIRGTEAPAPERSAMPLTPEEERIFALGALYGIRTVRANAPGSVIAPEMNSLACVFGALDSEEAPGATRAMLPEFDSIIREARALLARLELKILKPTLM